MKSTTDLIYKGRKEKSPAGIPVTLRLHPGPRIQRGTVRFDSDACRWSTKTDKGKTVQGSVGILWRPDPSNALHYVGGRFDWRGRGQTVKTLSNIPGGILGRQPPKGATVWFYLVNAEQTERSNVVVSPDKWG